MRLRWRIQIWRNARNIEEVRGGQIDRQGLFLSWLFRSLIESWLRVSQRIWGQDHNLPCNRASQKAVEIFWVSNCGLQFPVDLLVHKIHGGAHYQSIYSGRLEYRFSKFHLQSPLLNWSNRLMRRQLYVFYLFHWPASSHFERHSLNQIGSFLSIR